MTAAAPVDRPTAPEARERLRALAEPLGLDEETLAVPPAVIAADAAPAARSPIVLGAVPESAAPPAAVPSAAAPPPPPPPPPAPAEPPTGPVAVPPPRRSTARRGLLVAAVAVVLAGGVVGGVALTGGSSPLTAAPAAPVPGAPAVPSPAAPPAPPPSGATPAADPSTAPGTVAPDPATPGDPEDPDGGDAPLPVPPAPAPSTPGAPPAPTPCRSVVSSLAGTGATVRIVFTNRGAAPCTLGGFPAVRWVGAGGKAVGAPATHAGARGAALTLAPGGSAAATVRIVPVTEFDPTTCDAVAVRGLTVRAPGTASAATLPRTGKACSGKIASPQLAVSPVAAL
jgi:eukaryotic-like serine/threonine-protein kinase